MNQNRRYLIWSVITVLVVLGSVLVLIPSGARVALDVRRSALRTTPDGVAAFAQALKEFGGATAYRFESYSRSRPLGTEILLEPRVPLTPFEISVLLEWVEEGGVLVFSPSWEDPLLDSLGLAISFFDTPDSLVLADHPWTLTVERGPSYIRQKVPDVEAERLLEELGDDPIFSGWSKIALFPQDSLARGSWTPLVTHVTSGFRTTIAEDSTRDSTFVTTENVTLGWLERGQGGILAVANAEALSNSRLPLSPEARVLARALLADTVGAGEIRFSEYHQGIRGEGSLLGQTLSAVLDTAPGRIFVWLAVASLLLIWSRGRRFGSPVPRDPPPRRSPIEHVTALAEIYRSAKAGRLVADRLVRGAGRRTHIRVGPTREDVEALFSRWTAHPLLHESAERARASWAADPPDLISLARALDDITTTRTSVR